MKPEQAEREKKARADKYHKVNAELLSSCRELVDATAAAMRVITYLDSVSGADSDLRIQAFVDELKACGVADGFGVRAKAAIAKAEARKTGREAEGEV